MMRGICGVLVATEGGLTALAAGRSCGGHTWGIRRTGGSIRMPQAGFPATARSFLLPTIRSWRFTATSIGLTRKASSARQFFPDESSSDDMMNLDL